MQFDMSISLGNILVIVTLLGSLFSTAVKFRDEFNSKADRSEVDRVKESMQVIMQKLESAYNKLEVANAKLDEIKDEIKEQEGQINKLNNELIKIKAEHESNHK